MKADMETAVCRCGATFERRANVKMLKKQRCCSPACARRTIKGAMARAAEATRAENAARRGEIKSEVRKCEVCNRVIRPERLEAMPGTRRCVEHSLERPRLAMGLDLDGGADPETARKIMDG